MATGIKLYADHDDKVLLFSKSKVLFLIMFRESYPKKFPHQIQLHYNIHSSGKVIPIVY